MFDILNDNRQTNAIEYTKVQMEFEKKETKMKGKKNT